MRALILSGGNKPQDKIFDFYVADSQLIIGVDGGCKYLLERNIIPNYIVGDFDSSNQEDISFLESKGAIKYQYDSEKDFTDSEIAVELAIKNNIDEIIFLGGTGSRLDHTFANIGLMLKAKNKGVNLIIVDKNNKAYIVNKGCVFKRDENYNYISFLAYKEEVLNLNIRGAKYELVDFNLKVGEGRTVSNEFLDDEISINFSGGILLVIYSKD